MRSMRVTCPETAHLEEIEYEEDPSGMLITSCTRFSPPCAVRCARVCAARLDRKRRSMPDYVDDQDARVGDDTDVIIRVAE
jgi:hypothetical protein